MVDCGATSESFLPLCTKSAIGKSAGAAANSVLLPAIDVFGTSVFNASSDPLGVNNHMDLSQVRDDPISGRRRASWARLCTGQVTSVDDVDDRCTASEDKLLALPKG
jgi:hypothetical protein